MPENFSNMDNNEKLDKAKQVGGNIIRDRIIPKIKNGLGTELFTMGGLAAGTALGMKKGLAGKAYKDLSELERKQLLKKSITNQGLTGMAAGSAGGNIVVPAARLRKIHREELGTNPDLKDYAKVEMTHGLPTSLYWAAVLKNKGGLQKGLEHAAEGVEAFKKTKKMRDLKPVLHAGAGAGGLAVADQATDLLEFFNTPEAIVKHKKEELAKKNGGVDMSKSALEIIEEAFEKQASILDKSDSEEELDEIKLAYEIIDVAFEKQASVEEEFVKEASTFGEILKGKNVKKVDDMIAGVGKAKSVADVAGRVPGFIERTTEPYVKDFHEMAKSNQYLKHGDNGAINILDHKRKHYNLTDDEVTNQLRTHGSAVKNKKQAIEDHAKSQGYFAEEEGTGSRFDDLIHSRKYGKNAERNSQKRAILEKIKNGEELTMEDKKLATKLDNKFGIDVRSGKLKNMHEDIKGSHSELKAANDEKQVRDNLGKIHRLNNFKNVTGTVKGVADEVGRVGKDFDKTFTVNGQVPSEGLSRLRNEEQAKTFAARATVGAGVVGAGVVANKALNGQKQSQPQIDPYKFREPRPNNFNSQRSNNFNGQRSNNFGNDNIGKLAYEIVLNALEK